MSATRNGDLFDRAWDTNGIGVGCLSEPRAIQCGDSNAGRGMTHRYCKWVARLGVAAIALASAACGTSPAFPDPLAAGWRGAPVCERLHEDAGQRVLRCSFPPGTGHERHYHAPHFGYAVSGGRMRIVDEHGAREVDLATGSHYASEGTQWHEVLNVGDTTTIYLIVESK